MTYLDLINGVLRRLREDTVTTANETDYSQLVGEFVNDAKKQVELAHKWSALRTTVTLSTNVGTTNYTLTGAKQNAVLEQGLNDTTNQYLTLRPKHFFNDNTVLNTPADGSVTDFMFNGVNSAGDLLIQVYPTPDAVETLNFDLVIPQADLSADSTTLTIPSNPVMQMAFGMALRERGETGGQSAAEQFGVANAALNDAIAIDANRYQDEMYYYRV
ncbi:MAG: hypothetical protein CMO36_02530 [Verrucomicrobiaceae bacterium]|nr:hypothetical protein [Verrucomicrobiaceae bacterium]|tara:strand:- start:2073 stop:2720 length:648 start_codon:yes stop_codon:yes gene_type:complete